MITDINYITLLRWLVAVRLRKPRTMAWLKALTVPIRKRLYPAFKKWEDVSWYELKYQTGQVAYLEKVLNDRFDGALKRIFIGPGSLVDNHVYIYQDAESLPVFIYQDAELEPPVWLYTDGELGGTSAGSYDFVINVPVGLPNEEATLRAVADRYKRDGKSYIIQYF